MLNFKERVLCLHNNLNNSSIKFFPYIFKEFWLTFYHRHLLFNDFYPQHFGKYANFFYHTVLWMEIIYGIRSYQKIGRPI